MLTIHNLEVRFDVEGDDDAVFTRLFTEHVRRWERRREQECRRLQEAEDERALEDGDGGSW